MFGKSISETFFEKNRTDLSRFPSCSPPQTALSSLPLEIALAKAEPPINVDYFLGFLEIFKIF